VSAPCYYTATRARMSMSVHIYLLKKIWWRSLQYFLRYSAGYANFVL